MLVVIIICAFIDTLSICLRSYYFSVIRWSKWCCFTSDCWWHTCSKRRISFSSKLLSYIFLAVQTLFTKLFLLPITIINFPKGWLKNSIRSPWLRIHLWRKLNRSIPCPHSGTLSLRVFLLCILHSSVLIRNDIGANLRGRPAAPPLKSMDSYRLSPFSFLKFFAPLWSVFPPSENFESRRLREMILTWSNIFSRSALLQCYTFLIKNLLILY